MTDEAAASDLEPFWTGDKPKFSDSQGFRTYQVAKSHAARLRVARQRAERAAGKGEPDAWERFEHKRAEIVASFANEKAKIDTSVDDAEARQEQRAAQLAAKAAERAVRQREQNELRAAQAAERGAHRETERIAREAQREGARAAQDERRKERKRSAPARRLQWEARAFGIVVDVERNVVAASGQPAGRFAGSVMRVETLGQISRRVTATRLVTLGVFAFAVKKKQDDRELYLTIEGDGFQIAVRADTKKADEARSFAARYNTLAARSAAPAEPAGSIEAIPAPAATDLPGQLRQLAELHAVGALTDAEFRAAKSRLLGDEPGPQDQQPRAW